MSPGEVVERAIAEVLAATLPAHLRGTVGPANAREWVGEHLDTYTEDAIPLPWHNWVAYDSWSEPTFFVVLILKEEAVELFCGTGYWPEVRRFGEREIEDVPASEWYRAWSSRFDVPCPPLVLGKAVVKEWLGRSWE